MSTLAEQIAWLRAYVGDDAHWISQSPLRRQLQRDILATLEGMAAPGETTEIIKDCWGALNFILAFYEPGQRYLDTNAWKQAEASGRRAHAKARAYLDALPIAGDSHSPQQPTKEDLDVARKLLANIRFVDDDEDPDPAIELIAAALQSERSAAPRMTAAPVSGDALTTAADIITGLAVMTERSDEIACRYTPLKEAIAAALTAATDKARREALTECAQEARLIADTALNTQDQQRLRIPSASVDRIIAHHGGRASAAQELEAHCRALPPQNPGDAAPQEAAEK